MLAGLDIFDMPGTSRLICIHHFVCSTCIVWVGDKTNWLHVFSNLLVTWQWYSWSYLIEDIDPCSLNPRDNPFFTFWNCNSHTRIWNVQCHNVSILPCFDHTCYQPYFSSYGRACHFLCQKIVSLGTTIGACSGLDCSVSLFSWKHKAFHYSLFP